MLPKTHYARSDDVLIAYQITVVPENSSSAFREPYPLSGQPFVVVMQATEFRKCAPASHSTLPQRAGRVFLRRDLRHRADYFANQAAAFAETGHSWRSYSLAATTASTDATGP
jgi:hypothetical protein